MKLPAGQHYAGRGLTAAHLCRSLVGDRANRPVVVVRGGAAPTIGGEASYYTTPSGKTIVHHPGAYGWRTVYHCSTVRTVVGADWLRGERDRWVTDSTDGVRDWRRLGTARVVHGIRTERLLVHGWLVSAAGRTYHARRDTRAQAMQRAVRAWREARAAAAQVAAAQARIMLARDLVIVRPEDGIATGSCAAGVSAWMGRHGIAGPVTVGVALDEAAHDQFDRVVRACGLAVERAGTVTRALLATT